MADGSSYYLYVSLYARYLLRCSQIFVFCLFFAASNSPAQIVPPASIDFELGGITFNGAPVWLKKPEVEKTLASIKLRTGWSPSGVVVKFYNDSGLYSLALLEAHLPGAPAWGFADSAKNMIHVGPQCQEKDFFVLFGHELGHLISWQLFQGSIADYLEEGFAEWIAQNPNLRFSWINEQHKSIDARTIIDAMRQGGTNSDIHYRYAISHATVLFLATKCPDVIGILRESGSQNIDKLLADKCQTPFFLNSFQLWINEMAMGTGRPRY